MTRSRSFCALVLIVAATSCAQTKPPADDALDAKPWDTQKAIFPRYPKQEDLMWVYVTSAIPFAFFVDRASVSVGQDGIVRYTLVARSFAGATNVSYEGIRCESYEHRVYAFGRSDGTWVQARNSQWLPISGISANQHAALADDIFCSARGAGARSVEEALQALTRGNRPTGSLPVR